MLTRRRKRRLALTSLIDVIFLLLLFFMLSSSFTRFAEVEILRAGAHPEQAPDSAGPTHFVQLGSAGLRLNGVSTPLERLGAAVQGTPEGPSRVIVSVAGGVSAQDFVDVLVPLRALPDTLLAILDPA